jgi:sulfur-oxidizing protein SoxZ
MAELQHSMRMSAKLSGDVTEVKMIINHPMQTGRKKDDFGQLIPAHFIQIATVKLNGKTVLDMQWGTGIAKNPYLTFHLKGAKIGGKLEASWADNLGQTGTGEVLIEAA